MVGKGCTSNGAVLKEGADIVGWIQSNSARNYENKCHRADDWTTS